MRVLCLYSSSLTIESLSESSDSRLRLLRFSVVLDFDEEPLAVDVFGLDLEVHVAFLDFSILDSFVPDFLEVDDLEVLDGMMIFFLVEIFLPCLGGDLSLRLLRLTDSTDSFDDSFSSSEVLLLCRRCHRRRCRRPRPHLSLRPTHIDQCVSICVGVEICVEGLRRFRLSRYRQHHN